MTTDGTQMEERADDAEVTVTSRDGGRDPFTDVMVPVRLQLT